MLYCAKCQDVRTDGVSSRARAQNSQKEAQRNHDGWPSKFEALKAKLVNEDQEDEYKKCFDYEKDWKNTGIKYKRSFLKEKEIEKDYICGSEYKRKQKWNNKRKKNPVSDADLNTSMDQECANAIIQVRAA